MERNRETMKQSMNEGDQFTQDFEEDVSDLADVDELEYEYELGKLEDKKKKLRHKQELQKEKLEMKQRKKALKSEIRKMQLDPVISVGKKTKNVVVTTAKGFQRMGENMSQGQHSGGSKGGLSLSVGRGDKFDFSLGSGKGFGSKFGFDIGSNRNMSMTMGKAGSNFDLGSVLGRQSSTPRKKKKKSSKKKKKGKKK